MFDLCRLSSMRITCDLGFRHTCFCSRLDGCFRLSLYRSRITNISGYRRLGLLFNKLFVDCSQLLAQFCARPLQARQSFSNGSPRHPGIVGTCQSNTRAYPHRARYTVRQYNYRWARLREASLVSVFVAIYRKQRILWLRDRIW
jgi:hypothetical protein